MGLETTTRRGRNSDSRVWTLSEGLCSQSVHSHCSFVSFSLSLVIMIFVNYGGGGYWFFAHSKWNGITVADLVFPWFIWIMGVSVVFSFRGRKSDSVFSRLYQIIRRSLILMGLGLFLNNGEWVTCRSCDGADCHVTACPVAVSIFHVGADLSRWRIPGVLQRFAISYFVVAITELITFPVYNKWKV